MGIRRAGGLAAFGVALALVAQIDRPGPTSVVSVTSADPRTCAVPASQVKVTANETWRSRFHAYGDASASLGDWTGGDGAYTVRLPDGRRLWIFADTFLGQVNTRATAPHHSRPHGVPFINNAIVVEQAGTKRLVRTLHGGTEAAPRAYIDAGVTNPQSWFWPGTGVVQGDKVRLLLNRFHRTGPGGLDFAFDGTAVASIQLPNLTLLDDSKRLPSPDRGGVIWAHVLEQPDADYIYGSKDKNLYLARAPAGNLLGPWSYRSAGGTWSSDPAQATPIIADRAGGDAHVVQVNDSFVRLSVRTSPTTPFTNVIQAYFSCSPVGPWTAKGTPIHTTVEGAPGNDRIIYDAYIHPETVTNGTMLAEYSVNAFPNGELNFQKVHIYRPRFLTITINGLP